jgi:hypothetical protein
VDLGKPQSSYLSFLKSNFASKPSLTDQRSHFMTMTSSFSKKPVKKKIKPEKAERSLSIKTRQLSNPYLNF